MVRCCLSAQNVSSSREPAHLSGFLTNVSAAPMVIAQGWIEGRAHWKPEEGLVPGVAFSVVTTLSIHVHRLPSLSSESS